MSDIIISEGISFGINDTVVRIFGERERLKTVEKIAFTNEFSIPLVVELNKVGVQHLVNTPTAFASAIESAIGYWNRQGKIDQRVKKDLRKFIKQFKDINEDIVEGLKNHRHLLSKVYDDLPGMKICKQKICFKIPNEKGYTITLSIFFKGNQYTLEVAVTDGVRTKNFTRHRKLRNCNSLIKQFKDWETYIQSTAPDCVFISIIPIIYSYLFDNKIKMNTLLEDINGGFNVSTS